MTGGRFDVLDPIASAMRRGFRGGASTRLFEDHDAGVRGRLDALRELGEVPVAATWLGDQRFVLLTSERLLWCSGGPVQAIAIDDIASAETERGDVLAITMLDDEELRLHLAPMPGLGAAIQRGLDALDGLDDPMELEP